ncbi:Copia protein [Ceratobasidium theobromae]|uniref:Copia protein n=1 Tax=Ceratobasidium theobromae TaxID=1582974 RepID=A0A5N5Q7Y2_9AGAM|nr:Copia protein [Ceratobasidium theobromae]
MSKQIQNRLLAEDLRRKAKAGDSALFISSNRSAPSNNRPNNNQHTANVSKLICNNCSKPGHIAHNCRKPGRGAWKRNQGSSSQNSNPNRSNNQNNRNQFNNNNKGKGRAFALTDNNEFTFTFVEIPTMDNEQAYATEPTHTYILDSAATCHIGNNANQFKDLQPYSGQVKGMGGLAQIQGIGNINLYVAKDTPVETNGTYQLNSTSKIHLKDAYYIPDSPVNLISLSKLMDQRPEVEITAKHDKIHFYDPTKEETVATTIKIGTCSSRNPWQLLTSIDTDDFSYVTQSLSDWHLILGHVNTRTILNMVNQRLVKGVEITKQSTHNPKIDCIGCNKGKSTVRPFKKNTDSSEFPTEIGQVVYSDTWGPTHTASLQGNNYMITFTDGATRYTNVYFMKHKNEAFDKYKKMEAWLQTQFNKPIKRFHYDGGRELVHGNFQEYCTNKGTVITTTAPHSSSSNGMVENLNRRYTEKARALMQASPHTQKMPFLWQEAIDYINKIKNRTPTHIGNKYMSPYHALHGKLPDLSHYQLWGSQIQVLIQDDKNKIGMRTKSAILTSIEDSPSGSWRYLAWLHRSIQVTRNVYFSQKLPSPANSNEGEPMGTSRETKIGDLEDFVKIAPPIEGEIKEENIIKDGQDSPQESSDNPDLPMHTQHASCSASHSASRSALRTATIRAKRSLRSTTETPTAAAAATKPAADMTADGPILSSVRSVRSAYNSGTARLRNRRDHDTKPSNLDGPSTRTQSRRQAQGMNKPEDFNKLTKDHGGMRSEAFWVIPNNELNHYFMSHGFHTFTDHGMDEDDDFIISYETVGTHTHPVDFIPLEVHEELDTFMWCKDIPQTTAWLTNKPANLTSSVHSDNIDDLGEHPMYSQIMKHPVLRPMAEDAMEAELGAFHTKDVFELKPLPPHVNFSSIIPSHWRYMIKRDKDGNIIRVKARLVAGGDHQVPGRNFKELYTSTISIDTIRLMLAISCKFNFDIIHMDVDSAFLNSLLQDVIYVRQPPHYSDGTNRVWHLKKSMYGLRQAPCDWERHRMALFGQIGFTRLESETSIYIRHQGDKIAIIASYVDDLLIVTSRGYSDKVQDDIASIFKCKDLGPISLFLGIQIERDCKASTMKLSMPGYIKKIIIQMGMENCAMAHTPASHMTVLMPHTPEEAAPNYPYLSAIGRLLWLALTVCPELAYIIGALTRHTQSFTNAHITAIKQVLRYLAGTPEVGIHYKMYENDDMEIGYSDSSYGNKEEGRKSISGYAFMYCGAAVAWSSKSQPVVAASTQEAEYIALTHATKHAMWM